MIYTEILIISILGMITDLLLLNLHSQLDTQHFLTTLPVVFWRFFFFPFFAKLVFYFVKIVDIVHR